MKVKTIKHRAIYAGILLSIIFVFISLAQKNDFPVLKGPYLGQKHPGMTPVIFAPGILSTDRNEHFGPTFSPDGKEVFWSLWMQKEQFVFTMREENGKWTAPAPADFRLPFREDGMYFAPDGRRLYFFSRRPTNGGEIMKQDWDIWYIEKEGSRWGNPVRIGKPVNTEKHEVFVSVTRNHTLYFVLLENPKQLYRAAYKDGFYQMPQKLPEVINTGFHFSHAYVDPDDRFLIFCSDRSGGYGEGDLYIAFRKRDDTWTEAINLGPEINTEKLERSPHLSIDGKYLFFVRHHKIDNRYTEGDFYWVDAKIIEDLKPKELDSYLPY